MTLSEKLKNEIIVRTEVAYEQLRGCHSILCTVVERGSKEEETLYKYHDTMNSILSLLVDLGALKKEEDL